MTKPHAPRSLRRVALAPLVSRQFAFFLVAGGSAAAVNFGSGALVRLVSTSGPGYAISVVVGFTAGTLVSFVLNRRYTFQVGDQPVAPQALRFGLVALAGIALAWLFAEGLLRAVEALSPSLSPSRAESLSHVGAIGLVTLYNFVAMKFFALRRTTPRVAG